MTRGKKAYRVIRLGELALDANLEPADERDDDRRDLKVRKLQNSRRQPRRPNMVEESHAPARRCTDACPRRRGGTG